MNMGAKQYLRDFRRDFEWKKKEALRIKVLQRTQVKQQRERKVTVEEILSDSSPGKSDSHMKLKLLVAKDPKIFETRVYIQQDLVDILCLLW